MMVEGNSVKTPGIPSPGRNITVEESRKRLQQLIEGGKETAGPEVSSGREGTAIEQDTSPDPEASTAKDQLLSSEPLPGGLSSPAASNLKSPVNDQNLLSEDEEKVAKKSGINTALRWLIAWIERQRKKIPFKR